MVSSLLTEKSAAAQGWAPLQRSQCLLASPQLLCVPSWDHKGLTATPKLEVVLGIKLRFWGTAVALPTEHLCCQMMRAEAVPPHLHLGEVRENINS